MNNLFYPSKNHNIIYPKIDFILNEISKKKYFTFSKISVEWWQIFCETLINLNTNVIDKPMSAPFGVYCKPLNTLNIKANLDKINSTDFAIKMISSFEMNHKQGRNGGGSGPRTEWEGCPEVFKGVINYITKKCPKNFIIGITDRTPGKEYKKSHKYPDYSRPRHKIILQTINEIIPKTNKKFDAICWKYWGANGDFDKIIQTINKNDIQLIIVGPSFLKNFDKVYKIKNYKYIQIHDTKASLHIEEYKKEIIDLDKKINKPKAYIMQGGSATMWLSCALHDKLKNAFIFDVGKGLDYCIYRLRPNFIHKLI